MQTKHSFARDLDLSTGRKTTESGGQENDRKKKIPYKENEAFYFSLKNDSTALIQRIYNETLSEIKEYKISLKCETAYVKRYSTINGKRKIKIEKIVYQKVY